jgi:hypothetical protein
VSAAGRGGALGPCNEAEIELLQMADFELQIGIDDC